MKRIVWTVTLLLFVVGNNSAAPSPNLLQGSRKDSNRSEQEEKNDHVRTVTCDWASSGEVDAARLAEDNAIKLELYDAVKTRRGVVQAKKACATIEGDPAPIYAVAKGGKIKITKYYSKDRHFRFAGLLKFFGGNSYTTRQVEIGYLDQNKFIPLSRFTEPDGRKLFLRLKGNEYF